MVAITPTLQRMHITWVYLSLMLQAQHRMAEGHCSSDALRDPGQERFLPKKCFQSNVCDKTHWLVKFHLRGNRHHFYSQVIGPSKSQGWTEPQQGVEKGSHTTWLEGQLTTSESPWLFQRELLRIKFMNPWTEQSLEHAKSSLTVRC